MIVFAESAFKHGYAEDDFFEVLDQWPLKMRSRRGLNHVYELYRRNYAGDHLHIAYRKEKSRTVVFHMRRISGRERWMYQRQR